MFVGKLRRSGDSFIVTVPREEVERLQLQEGQQVTVEVRPLDLRPRLSPELRPYVDELVRDHAGALRDPAGR